VIAVDDCTIAFQEDRGVDMFIESASLLAEIDQIAEMVYTVIKGSEH
jgi:hypothetical protein